MKSVFKTLPLLVLFILSFGSHASSTPLIRYDFQEETRECKGQSAQETSFVKDFEIRQEVYRDDLYADSHGFYYILKKGKTGRSVEDFIMLKGAAFDQFIAQFVVKFPAGSNTRKIDFRLGERNNLRLMCGERSFVAIGNTPMFRNPPVDPQTYCNKNYKDRLFLCLMNRSLESPMFRPSTLGQDESKDSQTLHPDLQRVTRSLAFKVKPVGEASLLKPHFLKADLDRDVREDSSSSAPQKIYVTNSCYRLMSSPYKDCPVDNPYVVTTHFIYKNQYISRLSYAFTSQEAILLDASAQVVATIKSTEKLKIYGYQESTRVDETLLFGSGNEELCASRYDAHDVEGCKKWLRWPRD